MTHIGAEFPRGGKAKIALVGEAPGSVETMTGAPFQGPSGRLLNEVLRAVGVDRSDCLVTNTIDFELPKNDVANIAGPRIGGAGPFTPWVDAPVASGGYLPEHLVNEQLGRLRKELEETRPDVIVPLGGLACWALFAIQGHGAIKKIRGAPMAAKLVKGQCLPTFHPAFILRSYHLYPLLLSDLSKALRLAEGTLPTADIEMWMLECPEQFEEFIARLSHPISVDIETVKHCLIDCIGFADQRAGFCAQFFDNKTFKPKWDEDDEIDLRRRVCRFLESDVPKVFQNGGGYDLQMLWEFWRVPTRGYVADTRILHKSLFPELPADLASMAALHTVMPSWKPIKAKAEKRNA